MLHYVTDALSGNKVAINSKHVVAVFKIVEGEHNGKTSINLSSGQIIVDEEDYEIVAMLNVSGGCCK